MCTDIKRYYLGCQKEHKEATYKTCLPAIEYQMGREPKKYCRGTRYRESVINEPCRKCEDLAKGELNGMTPGEQDLSLPARARAYSCDSAVFDWDDGASSSSAESSSTAESNDQESDATSPADSWGAISNDQESDAASPLDSWHTVSNELRGSWAL